MRGKKGLFDYLYIYHQPFLSRYYRKSMQTETLLMNYAKQGNLTKFNKPMASAAINEMILLSTSIVGDM